MSDFSEKSRFAADEGFSVKMRKNQTVPSIVIIRPSVRSSLDQFVRIIARYEYRWDIVAFETLGDADLKWILWRHNNIADPSIGPRVGDKVFIPTQDQISYYRGG